MGLQAKVSPKHGSFEITGFFGASLLVLGYWDL